MPIGGLPIGSNGEALDQSRGAFATVAEDAHLYGGSIGRAIEDGQFGSRERDDLDVLALWIDERVGCIDAALGAVIGSRLDDDDVTIGGDIDRILDAIALDHEDHVITGGSEAAVLTLEPVATALAGGLGGIDAEAVKGAAGAEGGAGAVIGLTITVGVADLILVPGAVDELAVFLGQVLTELPAFTLEAAGLGAVDFAAGTADAVPLAAVVAAPTAGREPTSIHITEFFPR